MSAVHDVLSSLGFEALVLADLLECKATYSEDSALTDPLYFAAGQFRAFQRRLEEAEQSLVGGCSRAAASLRSSLPGGAQ